MSFLLYCLTGCRTRLTRARRLLLLSLGVLLVEPAMAGVAPGLPSDPVALVAACESASASGTVPTMQRLRTRLLELSAAPTDLAQVLFHSEALLACQAPTAALAVLDRYGPAPGLERRQWLVQQWRAASAALEHERAAQALLRLMELEHQDLERLTLPIGKRPSASPSRQRPALDLLADHLEALGRPSQASALLLASRQSGEWRARRLRRGVLLGTGLSLAERDRWLEQALDEAAAIRAWGLASDLLDDQVWLHLQAGEDFAKAVQRRIRLSQRLDDAYGEWRLRRHDPLDRSRAEALEQRLRSPASPGGHAGVPAPRLTLP